MEGAGAVGSGANEETEGDEYQRVREGSDGGREGTSERRCYEACPHALAAWPMAARDLLAMEAGNNSGWFLWWLG